MTDVERTSGSSHRSSIPRWLVLGGSWGWRFVALAAAFTVLGYVIGFFQTAVLPVLLAVLLTTLLEPIARFLRNHKVPRPLAGGLSVVLGSLVLSGLLIAVGFAVAGELEELGASLEKGYRQLVQWSAERAGVAPAEVSEWVESHVSELRSSAGSYSGAVLDQLGNMVQGGTVLALAVVFTWFFTWDGDQQFDRLVGVLPAHHRPHGRELGQRIWRTISAYMRGMFVIAAADAILFGIGLWIIDMPLIVPLMLMLFLGAMVPFVGPVIAGAAAGLIGLADGGLTQGLLAVGIALVVQQIEGNLLQPFIMGRAVQLHPSVVLFAVTAGAVLAGVVGILFAVPITASVSIILAYAREKDVI